MSKEKNKDKSTIEFLKRNTLSVKEIKDQVKRVLPISPAIQYVLGGGITEGSFNIITGDCKAGKTATAIQIGKSAQELGYKVVYVDGEHRLKERDLESTDGMDEAIDKFEVITSVPGHIMTAEKALDAARYKIEVADKTLVIIDSISMLCPNAIFVEGSEYAGRDPMAKMLSNFVKRISAGIKINNNIFVGITHQYANTSGKGFKTKLEASGGKIQYGCDFKIEVEYYKPWIEGEHQIGLEIKWKGVYSGLGPPNRKATGYLRFGHGLDKEAEIFDLIAVAQHPLMKVSGSWINFNDGQYKVQGQSKAIDILKTDKELYKKVEEAVWERLGNRIGLANDSEDAGD